ncbi:MAG: hypothetical protein Q9187_003473 [Circinaria calcarea]
MAGSPPTSPLGGLQRPTSALIRSPRSTSRMSVSSRQGGGSRASDEDGRASVKVAIRIRPPLKSTDPGFELIPQRFQRSMVHVTSPTSLAIDSPQGRKLFVFDRVFGEDVHQDGVWEYTSESVNAFIQGYNVSVLAYGQSGAGKSYTMGTSGPAEQSDPHLKELTISPGVIPRAAMALFEKLSGPPVLHRNGSSGIRTPTRYSTNSVHTLQSLAKAGSEKCWQLKATYVEIYNEQLRDLLVPEQIPYTERSTVTIREDTKGRILLTGLHQVTINSVEDLLGALNFGSSIRQTDATAINAKSSRSHAIFSLNLIQRKTKVQQISGQEKRYSVPLDSLGAHDNCITVDSKLHFVDLAGSERMKNTGASGDRAKEGISINAGLASLGKVISQLSSRQASAHISYRDSKLTRLLQDSLGGNAITYMIACITPAEFHLSETLNTVQYAQRARAIQSKPRIQQVSDENDKQALIDRLRAEVSFLREQIRSTERGDRGSDPLERPDRQYEREVELQNHLLDIQENYSALSQRHAKLISEITKARDDESIDLPAFSGAVGDSAVDRLNRSNSLAEAVENVVLEYEKTIQSLETSLSSTRSSLSNTESSLLERETKCAYVETLNMQLQTRVRKLVDREASTEQYLHDLEAKLDGRTTGDEKNTAIVSELRKEIARIRENEASCEEYISNLEERLAEADQDMDLMQREIGRLEHVVERQRSLGKLDGLLYELDHIQSNGNPLERVHLTNGFPQERSGDTVLKLSPEAALKAAVETAIPESDDEDWEHPPPLSPEAPSREASETYLQSPAQSKFVGEKLENVTQELFDLRLEHESTVNEYDILSAKYEEALRTLASLQEAALDSSRSSTSNVAVGIAVGNPSFLENARLKELKYGGQLSSSRSLSSELSLAGGLPTPTESYLEPSKQVAELDDERTLSREDMSLANEVDHLKVLQAEREEGMNVLHTKYVQLQEQHMDTLDLVEELKAEVQKARRSAPHSSPSHAVRRRSSQNVMAIDRAHRSLASLGNIASENFEDKPDTMQSFELNLNTAMHELHQRSERVQVLEAELSIMKKEMETKMTIISGLTRERSSLKGSSPVDISVVSSMRDQILLSESQMMMLRESHAARERDMANQIRSLQESLSSHTNGSPSGVPETPPMESNDFDPQRLTERQLPDRQVSELQRELSTWERKHTLVVESMQASEKKLLATIANLEASLAGTENRRHEKSKEFETQSVNISATAAGFETEKIIHAETVKALTKEINGHKAVIDSNVKIIHSLEESHTDAQRMIEEGTRFRQATQEQLNHHHDQISSLEDQLAEHRSAVEFHKHGLKSLHDSQSKELEDVRSSALRQAEADTEARIADLVAQHDENLAKAKEEAEIRLQKTIQGLQNQVKDLEAAIDERGAQIEELQKEREYNAAAKTQTTSDLENTKSNLTAAEEAKAAANASLLKVQATVDELTKMKQELSAELEDLREKEQRASRLVEELEGQLSSTFENTRITSSRLSSLQTTRDIELLEARAATASAQEEIDVLTKRLKQIELQHSSSPAPFSDGFKDRSNSMSSRKSGSIPALPSPPPAIPLPPLPTTMPYHTTGALSPTNAGNFPSEIRRSSKEVANSQMAEDQEARIRTIEKHLYAEKQLTATLEEALIELEAQSNKAKFDMETWKKRARSYEDELAMLRKERNVSRSSLQAVEEERHARKEAEAARAHLEETMAALNKKKKKSGFNCF